MIDNHLLNQIDLRKFIVKATNKCTIFAVKNANKQNMKEKSVSALCHEDKEINKLKRRGAKIVVAKDAQFKMLTSIKKIQNVNNKTNSLIVNHKSIARIYVNKRSNLFMVNIMVLMFRCIKCRYKIIK